MALCWCVCAGNNIVPNDRDISGGVSIWWNGGAKMRGLKARDSAVHESIG